MTDARAALRPEVLKHRILPKQVALMCRLTTSPLIGSLVIGAILAYPATEDAGLRVSGAWYFASLVIMVIRWRVVHAFLRRLREHAEVLRWRSAMLMLIVLFGAIWSIPAGFLLPADPGSPLRTRRWPTRCGVNVTGRTRLAGSWLRNCKQ